MTALTNLAELDILDLLMTNVAFPDIGDAAGLLPSAAPGTWAISLNTTTLTDTDTVQTSGEAAYTNYVRQTVVRTTGGWTVGGDGLADNDAAITYPTSGSGPETETDTSLGGRDASNVMHIYGALAAPLVVNSGVTPEYAIGALDITAA